MSAIRPVAEPPASLLQVRGLQAWYGESQALHGIDLDVRAGELITLLGRNGAGKSTTLKALMGVVRIRRGSVVLAGQETISMRPMQIARLGMAYCPEERGIFAKLDVLENLLLPPVLSPGALTVEQVLGLFPNLRERIHSPGTRLSGGEQQMLAIGRILRTGAKILLLDEPSEGLAPIIIQQIELIIAQLKTLGFTVVLVEQNLDFAHNVADRHYVVENGQVVEVIDRSDFASSAATLKKHLGI